jgi:hypothetical protein
MTISDSQQSGTTSSNPPSSSGESANPRSHHVAEGMVPRSVTPGSAGCWMRLRTEAAHENGTYRYSAKWRGPE